MALPLFVRKFMAPVEVKLVLSALAEETRHLNDGPDQNLWKMMATGIIMPRVVDDILGWAKQIKDDISNNSKPPRAIALWLMANVTRNYLASGHYHIYRGMLSMQGQALRGMAFYCFGELTKIGQMTEEEKTAALKTIAEEIREVG
jgi:hypothetical protein